MLKRFFFACVFLSFGCAIALVVGVVLIFNYYSRDLPGFNSVADYQPSSVSTVYSRDGKVIAEFYDKRRYPVRLSEVPEFLQHAFVAAEDANFYNHPGIDIFSIVRALVKNLQAGAPMQGGSTITQQVVKNLLLSPERSIERKIKEAILSYRLEKRLSKKEILELYLNEIFFGNTAYGVKAAARLYFQKELSDLTLGEGALLAGLPKAPSRYSPLANPERAFKRQRYVLDQMVDAGFISADQADAARKEQLTFFRASNQNIFNAPYYVTEVRKWISDNLPNVQVDTAGLLIHTAVDLSLNNSVEKELAKGLRIVDKRRGWRGILNSFGENGSSKYFEHFAKFVPSDLKEDIVYPALIKRIDAHLDQVEVQVGSHSGFFLMSEAAWTNKRIDYKDNVQFGIPLSKTLHVGDIVEVSLVSSSTVEAQNNSYLLKLDQTPQLEGAVAVIDPHSGEVVAAVGGYDFARNRFNRVTQMLRQPGSAFKPIIYLTAIDAFGYTPSTIVNDIPRVFKVGTQFWAPGNFDSKFMGPIPLFRALELSRNLVSADLVSRIGLDALIDYAQRLGIKTELKKNLSLSLGSGELHFLELVRAYGVLPAGGMLFPSTFVTKIVNRDGVVIFDSEIRKADEARQVISPQTAFVMSSMMRGVIERGTATRLKKMNREIAGKTGTTNDQMDAWFIGFNPDYVCGVWVGFDTKRTIGEKETGGVVAAPIFMNIMTPFLQQKEAEAYQRVIGASKKISEEVGNNNGGSGELQADSVTETKKDDQHPIPSKFIAPDGVTLFWVDKRSGYASEEKATGAIPLYFTDGTQPTQPPTQEEETTDSYLEDLEL
jgi:penicillin-binding protein 1A